jgi:hypothetical protein
MKQQEVFDAKLEAATEIRTHIQDELRATYTLFKQLFEVLTGQPGKVLKHVVDMYHYREGGYPNANSAPKHQELVERFAWMVHWFNFVGLSGQYKEELKKYGIYLNIDQTFKIGNRPIEPEALEALQEYPEFAKRLKSNKPVDFRLAIRAFLFACDELQGTICKQSNVIKHELAPEVEQQCEIRKGDFTSSIMVNYHKTTGRVTKKKMQRLRKNLKSKLETGTFNINNIKSEIPE